jgi:hypothetical protein
MYGIQRLAGPMSVFATPAHCRHVWQPSLSGTTKCLDSTCQLAQMTGCRGQHLCANCSPTTVRPVPCEASAATSVVWRQCLCGSTRQPALASLYRCRTKLSRSRRSHRAAALRVPLSGMLDGPGVVLQLLQASLQAHRCMAQHSTQMHSRPRCTADPDVG